MIMIRNIECVYIYIVFMWCGLCHINEIKWIGRIELINGEVEKNKDEEIAIFFFLI